MRQSIPLNILDAYAKTITSKQANMLYESKFNKKYKKRLYENMNYDDNDYSIFLSNYTLDEANSSVEKALIKYPSKHKLLYNVVSEGVYFYAKLPENYMALVEDLIKDGFNKKTLKEIVEPCIKNKKK